MKCEEFWENGADSPDHLRECAACASLHEREQRVAAGLKALGAQWRRTEAPARVERRLVAAFRAEMGVAPALQRGRWLPLLTWGSAMAAVVVLALFLTQGRPQQPVQRQARGGMELASADAPYAGDMTPALNANGFIPLPNAEQIEPGDEVDVVRMEVPRAALIALGIPMSEGDASESVEADVVLGGDGMARAVRFLD